MHDSKQIARTLELKTKWLSQIENHLFYNPECDPIILFDLYRKIWQQQEIIATGSKAEHELLKSGLVVLYRHKIKLANFARQHFNESWIENQLMRLQPYNKIRLRLFNLDIRASYPYKVLVEVDFWTGGQPFLTQKLCQLICDRQSFILRNSEATQISELVYRYIIDDWERGLAATHLLELRSQLLAYPSSIESLLTCYQQIWQSQTTTSESTPEQQYLLGIGLIRLERDRVKIANQIYRNVFDRLWIKKHLTEKLSVEHEQHSANLSLKQISKNVKSKFLRSAGVILLLLLVGGGTKLSLSLTIKYERIRQIRQAERLHERGQYSAAIAAYDRLLETDIDRPHLFWIARGTAWSELEDYRQMLESCSTAISVEPQASLAWNCRGEALYHLKQYQAAETAFQKAIALNPHSSILWLNQSQVLNVLQKHDKALAANKRAIALLRQSAPQNRSERRNLAIAFEQKGQSLLKSQQDSAALSAFQQSLKYSSNYFPARQGKAIALYRLGEYETAIETLEQILRQDNLTPEPKAVNWLYLGINLCQIKSNAAAKEAFQQVVQLSSDPQAKAIAEAGCGIQ